MQERKRGRPTKYDPKFNDIAYKLCSIHGYTDPELAKMLDVDVATITNWKQDYPEFFAAIKKGKKLFDDGLVVQALHKRATGYNKIVQRISKSGDVVDCLEEVPPDPVSMIFWLKNRQPGDWRDRQEVAVSGDVQININLESNLKLNNANPIIEHWDGHSRGTGEDDEI